MGSTLLAAAFATACLLAGGFYESTYSLLAAAAWLGLAVAGSVAPLRRPSAAVWALAGLALWTALSALWGPAGPALRVAPLAALYAGALLAAEQVDRRLLLRLTWGICVLVVATALAAAALGLAPEAPGPDSSRLAWPLGYANGLGLVAATGVLLSFLLPRRPALAGGALCAAALALTYSRTAILAGLVGLVLLAALRGRIPRKAAVAGGLALAVLAAALAQPLAARFAAPAPDERDARRLLDVSGHGRGELWRSAWEQGLERPVAGRGAGTWARGYVEETGSLAAPANAHSLPLETFAELGLVGIVLLAAFLILVARGARREPVAAAVVAAWTVGATADWVWQLPAATLPMIFAAAILTAREKPCVSETQSFPALAAVALAVGALCAAHGVGAALLESGQPRRAEPLLPWDARPAVARGDLARACRVDAGELALARADPPGEGCRSR
jgi:O-antigen ligase